MYPCIFFICIYFGCLPFFVPAFFSLCSPPLPRDHWPTYRLSLSGPAFHNGNKTWLTTTRQCIAEHCRNITENAHVWRGRLSPQIDQIKLMVSELLETNNNSNNRININSSLSITLTAMMRPKWTTSDICKQQEAVLCKRMPYCYWPWSWTSLHE